MQGDQPRSAGQHLYGNTQDAIKQRCKVKFLGQRPCDFQKVVALAYTKIRKHGLVQVVLLRESDGFLEYLKPFIDLGFGDRKRW